MFIFHTVHASHHHLAVVHRSLQSFIRDAVLKVYPLADSHQSSSCNTADLIMDIDDQDATFFAVNAHSAYLVGCWSIIALICNVVRRNARRTLIADKGLFGMLDTTCFRYVVTKA